jgi:hypothetical protein
VAAAHPLQAEKPLSRFEEELAGTPLWTIVWMLGAAFLALALLAGIRMAVGEHAERTTATAP